MTAEVQGVDLPMKEEPVHRPVAVQMEEVLILHLAVVPLVEETLILHLAAVPQVEGDRTLHLVAIPQGEKDLIHQTVVALPMEEGLDHPVREKVHHPRAVEEVRAADVPEDSP